MSQCSPRLPVRAFSRLFPLPAAILEDTSIIQHLSPQIDGVGWSSWSKLPFLRIVARCNCPNLLALGGWLECCWCCVDIRQHNRHHEGQSRERGSSRKLRREAPRRSPGESGDKPRKRFEPRSSSCMRKRRRVRVAARQLSGIGPVRPGCVNTHY